MAAKYASMWQNFVPNIHFWAIDGHIENGATNIPTAKSDTVSETKKYLLMESILSVKNTTQRTKTLQTMIKTVTKIIKKDSIVNPILGVSDFSIKLV